MPHTVPAGLLNRPLRCLAAKVVRADGVTIGLTDTNQNFTFDGALYQYAAGMTASSIPSDTTVSGGVLSVKTLEASVAAAITAKDIRAGKYEGADVWIYELDPTIPGLATMMPAQAAIVRGRYRVSKAEIKRAEKTFTLKETLSLLTQSTGRTVEKRCDVEVTWNKRCDPSQTLRAEFSFSRMLQSAPALDTLLFAGDSHASGYFACGQVVWTSGANAGLAMNVKAHSLLAGNVAQIVLSNATGSVLTGYPPAAGDVATLVRGCDRTAATCQSIPNPHEATGTNFPNF